MHKLIFTTLVLTSLSQTNYAATFNVNTFSQLSSNISSAADGDTLNVTSNIILTSELYLNKSLVFQGNGYTLSVPSTGLTDAGILNNSSSAFRIFSIGATGKTIEFNNLIFKGGNPSSGSGGAISINSGTVYLKQCKITHSGGNAIVSGGGLYNNGTCFLYQTEISRNAAPFGGGYDNRGALFIEYSSILENRTLGSSSNGGGGINLYTPAKTYINNSSFSNNKASGMGGGLYNYDGSVYICNSSFTGNVVYGNSQGGGITHSSPSGQGMHLVNCLLAYNYAKNPLSAATTAPTGFTLNDLHCLNTVKLYYSIYSAASTSGFGSINSVISNNINNLAADGSNNNLFTGGLYTPITDDKGNDFGTGQVFQPFLIKIANQRIPAIKANSYTLDKGCTVGFTNGSGTPIIGYKNMNTYTWSDILNTGAAPYAITNDQCLQARSNPPSVGAMNSIDNNNYIAIKIRNAPNSSVTGASIYGDVYPLNSSLSLTALPNTGYYLSNWSYIQGGVGTVAGNPLNITLAQNTILSPNLTTTPQYTLTYLGNGHTSGVPPAISNYAIGTSATIAANTGSLSKSNYIFTGWNTMDNGSGASYNAGATYGGGANLVLYAQWAPNETTLPIDLLTFEATLLKEEPTVFIEWATATETHNSHFDIQRSLNAVQWETIGQVKGAGTSLKMNEYGFRDNQVQKGKSYYRLKQVDFSGQYHFSKIVSIIVDEPLTAALLYPNPAQTYIQLQGLNSSGVYQIYNTLGVNVINSVRRLDSNDSTLKVDISNLPKGSYILAISDKTYTFIKE